MTQHQAPEVTSELRDDIERDIRIAIWNAGMKGGMGQDLSQAFIKRAMAEPTMIRALEAAALIAGAGREIAAAIRARGDRVDDISYAGLANEDQPK